MRHLRNPAAFALTIAIAISLAIHLPIYGALGLLAKVWKDAEQEEPPSVTVEFELGEPTESAPEPEIAEAEETEPTQDAPAESSAEVAERPPREEPRRQREEPEEIAQAQEEEAAEEEALPVPPPEERINLQAVQQRSQNPEEAPDNPRYMAEENNRVEEETQARLRNYQRDDVEQSAGAASEASASEDLGNDTEQEIADARDMEGSDQRTATESEAREERPRESPDRPLPSVAARGDTTTEGGDRGGATAMGGGAPPERTIEVSDGMGTFRIAVREPRPEGTGPGEAGGPARPASGRGDRGRGDDAGDPGTAARRGERGWGRGSSHEGPDLRVSWSQFEEVYTEEELQEERQAWVEERRSRLRGSNRQEEWQRFRAAIENFLPNVRPGNQTALNAAASPFANYLAHVHRRIHRQFVDSFLRGLPAGGTSPFADQSLHTKLEIILNRDGTVHRIGVVKTSGFLPFDQGAFASVMRAQPYPEAPTQILSGDGRVYIHWGFYRGERQCGTFNAEPYILPNPPGTPGRGGGPLRDRGVVEPERAPAGGAQPEEGSEPDHEHDHEEGEGNEDGAPPREDPTDSVLG